MAAGVHLLTAKAEACKQLWQQLCCSRRSSSRQVRLVVEPDCTSSNVDPALATPRGQGSAAQLGCRATLFHLVMPAPVMATTDEVDTDKCW